MRARAQGTNLALLFPKRRSQAVAFADGPPAQELGREEVCAGMRGVEVLRAASFALLAAGDLEAAGRACALYTDAALRMARSYLFIYS
eukprot:tig00020746_g13670.t1